MIHSAYAFECNAKMANNSASGGAFIAIAYDFFEKYEDGIVYGVELKQGGKICYSVAHNIEECSKFQGSKYVECNILECKDSIKKNLENDFHVMVTGLPCQIYALKAYLNKMEIKDDNLLTVDIMCHGTPHNKIWNDYIVWLEKHYCSTLKDYSFRYKMAKWKNYPAMAAFNNGKIVVNSMEVRLYNKLFLSGLIMRDCCYRCKFATVNREADITLADFWGIEEVMPEFDKHISASLILSNSTKGENVINELNNYGYNNIKKCQNNDYIKFQHNLNAPTERPLQYEEFQLDYKEKGLEYCLSKYAGYNYRGKILFYIKKIMNEIGLVYWVRKLISRYKGLRR